MDFCAKCRRPLEDGEGFDLGGRIVCDDCYLEMAAPRNPGVQYSDNPSNFMRRLKRTYTVKKQQID